MNDDIMEMTIEEDYPEFRETAARKGFCQLLRQRRRGTAIGLGQSIANRRFGLVVVRQALDWHRRM